LKSPPIAAKSAMSDDLIKQFAAIMGKAMAERREVEIQEKIAEWHARMAALDARIERVLGSWFNQHSPRDGG